MTIHPTTGTRALKGRRPATITPVTLAERVAGEMSAAWSIGRRRPAEDFLAGFPELVAHPEAASRVIYEEYCLREGLGQEPDSAELFRRFPQWSEHLRILLDCHDLIRPRAPLPCPFDPGDLLGEYRIHSLLGQGRRGSVFLATQSTLADRPVVLKLTRRLTGGHEHLALARVPHPHVVPLYSVHDFPDRDLRALCMPYLGGTTLDRLLDGLEDCHPPERTGDNLIALLDGARTELTVRRDGSDTRLSFATSSYPQIIRRFGAQLAEALHFAHTRGLLHLDLKPSNVLIGDDGEPMLLDFHLAQSPLSPGSAWPERIGGTFGYMAPEHEAAMDAVLQGRTIPHALDARADVYALGVTLYEAITGTPPPGANVHASVLLRANPRAGSALAAVVTRCLCQDPDRRYASAAELAGALRRPPFAGVEGLWRNFRPAGFTRLLGY